MKRERECNSHGPSQLELELKMVAEVENLEKQGIHAHSLLQKDGPLPDANMISNIDQTIHKKEAEEEKTFGQRNRIMNRRRTRLTGLRLLRHIR